jgi:hypothetical protein
VADPIKLQELEAQQEEVMKLVTALETETAPERVQALANQLERAARALDERVAAFEKQELHRVQIPKGRIEIALTPDQRGRILAETGIDLPFISLPDETSNLSRTMPQADPARIERLARKVALQLRAERESQEGMRTQVQQLLDQIGARGGKGAREFIERLKLDGGRMK